MSKRITFTDFEIEQLTKGLEQLIKDSPGINYEVVNVGRRFYNQLINKLKTEPSSQKVSSSSVKPIISGK